MNFLSQRALGISPSATLELSAKAGAMKAAGLDVLNLTAGQPDLPTPALIVEAAHRALDQGHFGYTATPGVPALRELVAAVYGERLGIPVEAPMICVSNGAKQALYNALATATDPGDRVGILVPYWVSYAEQARALGCEVIPIACPASRGFRPDPEALGRALDEGLDVLIVNSPNNPTGAAFGREDWEIILDLLEPTSTRLISDEIYEQIVYREEGHISPLHLRPELAERTCVISGLSKSYAMTGWRVGYSIAPRAWTSAMSALQGHVTSNINAVTQQAAIVALQHPELVAPMVEIFRGRKALVERELASMPALKAHPPEGAFYAYIDISAFVGGKGQPPDGAALAARLLEDHHLALVPGDAFGDPSHFRLSFAAPDDVLREAFSRLRTALG